MPYSDVKYRTKNGGRRTLFLIKQTFEHSFLQLQENLSNPTCTWREIVCRDSQVVGLNGVKHREDGQKCMKVNVG